MLAEEGANGATGNRAVALSDLLPHVSGRVSQERRKTNLEAFGFPLREEFPRIVGPFSVFDARVFLSQTVIDMSAVNDLRAADHSVTAARHSARSARDLVVLVAANLYLQTLATGARAVDRSSAARHGDVAPSAGAQSAAERTRGWDRRRACGGEVEHRAAACDGRDQRIREVEAATRARHRSADRDRRSSSFRRSRLSLCPNDARRSARAGVPRAA